MFDIFNQDPTYGIKDPELFFSTIGPDFLGLWFELQEEAEKEKKIFFLDTLPDDFTEQFKNGQAKLYGWLIPYDLRQSFHDPWITSNDYIVHNLWKDFECSAQIRKEDNEFDVDFNVYSTALPKEMIEETNVLVKDYKEIDLDKWKRKEHFKKFADAIIPNYSMVIDLDITDFLKYIKKNGYSFTLSMAYLIAKAMNQVEEFRYRIRDNKVLLYPQIDPTIRYLDFETGLFKDVKVPLFNTLPAFIETAEKLIDEQKESFVEDDDLGIIQFSSTPWYSFKSLTPIVGNENNGIPVIVWGKYEKEDDKIMLPLYIEVNHAFVDGFHIAQFLEILEEELSFYKN